MRHLSIDIETRSSADIGKTGLYRYAQDKDFGILLFAYKLDEDPVKIVDLEMGEKIPDQIPQSGFQKDIYKIKNRQQFSGKMHHLYQIQYPQDQRDPYGIRFDNVPHFQPSSLHPFRSIQTEQIIQQQVYRYNRQYCRRIDPERKCSHTPVQKQEFDHPCNKVGDYDHKSIQCHMQAVKMLLVFFNQGLITLCSNM